MAGSWWPGATGTVVQGVGEPLRDSGRLLVETGRLAVRHGPALLAVVLLGSLGHDAMIDAAVKVSERHSVLSWLVLLVAPLFMLGAFVLMLRLVRPSLRSVPPAPPVAGRRLSAAAAALGDVANLLVPFLTAYQVAGFLSADIRTFWLSIAEDSALSAFDEWAGVDIGGRADSGRAVLTLSPVFVAVVAAAVLLRWLLARYGGARRRVWVAVPAAYLETLWLTLVLVVAVRLGRDLLWTWVSERRLVAGIRDLWDAWSGVLGPLRPLHDTVTGWVGAGLGSADRVLLLPLAWLTVAAVVYGRTAPDAAEPSDGSEGSEGSERSDGGPADGSGGQAAGEETDQRTDPGDPTSTGDRRGRHAEPPSTRFVLVSRLTDRVRADLAQRYAGLIGAIRQLRRNGLVPSLVFCLGFLAVWSVQTLLLEVERVVVGPLDVPLWYALRTLLDPLHNAVALSLLVCLVAAATDRSFRLDPPAETPVRPAGATAGATAAPGEATSGPAEPEPVSPAEPEPAVPRIGATASPA